jgi:hypothetical protein
MALTLLPSLPLFLSPFLSSAEHPEFELTYDMMLGIRTVIGRISAQPPKAQLDTLDFTEENTLVRWIFDCFIY